MKQYITCLQKSKHLQILNYGIVRNDNIQFTDLDQWVFIPVDKPIDENTIINNAALKKSNSLEKSIDNGAIEAYDMPIMEDTKLIDVLPIDVVAKLPDFINYTSKDFLTTISLTGICINMEAREIAATNGHILRKEMFLSIPTGKKGAYIVPVCAVKFIKAIKKESVKCVGIVESNDTSYFHIRLENGVCYNAKLIEGPYPDYSRVFDTDQNETLSSSGVKELLESVKEITSYPRDGVKNITMDNTYLYWGAISGKIKLPIKSYFKNKFQVYYNADYLKLILGDICKIKAFPRVDIELSKLYCNIFEVGSSVFILMPLRKDWEDFNPREYKEVK